MTMINPASGNGSGLPAHSLHMIRDMIVLALDATEAENLPELNRKEARAALAEALDVMDGGRA